MDEYVKTHHCAPTKLCYPLFKSEQFSIHITPPGNNISQADKNNPNGSSSGLLTACSSLLLVAADCAAASCTVRCNNKLLRTAVGGEES